MSTSCYLLSTATDHSGNALQHLDYPLLTVSKVGEVVNVLPTALRFWGKLGLSPRSGTKDVVAFAIFDQTHGLEEQEVVNLLDRMSAIYGVSTILCFARVVLIYSCRRNTMANIFLVRLPVVHKMALCRLVLILSERHCVRVAPLLTTVFADRVV